jgi:hypothetical protein
LISVTTTGVFGGGGGGVAEFGSAGDGLAGDSGVLDFSSKASLPASLAPGIGAFGSFPSA